MPIILVLFLFFHLPIILNYSGIIGAGLVRCLSRDTCRAPAVPAERNNGTTSPTQGVYSTSRYS